MADPVRQSSLKFLPFQSRIDVSFWAELNERKLDVYKLSEAAIPVRGFFSSSRYSQVPTHFYVDSSSFLDSGTSAPPHPDCYAVSGQLINTNTVESFTALPKQAVLDSAAALIWADITSGAAVDNPHLLTRFVLLTHGDLKRYKFTYWFAFPALKPPAPFTVLSPPAALKNCFPSDVANSIAAACDQWRGLSRSLDTTTPGTHTHASLNTSSTHPFWLVHYDSLHATCTPHPLADFASLRTTTTDASSTPTLFLAFSDPGHLPAHPGWPLRNALMLALHHWGLSHIHVVAVRDSTGRTDINRSLHIHIQLFDPTAHPAHHPTNDPASSDPSDPSPTPASTITATEIAATERGSTVQSPEDPPLHTSSPPVPAAVGWETTAQGKLAPQTVDLAPLMNPLQLAEQAVDLNLRLMRWRAAPALDVSALKPLRCLLLGAGTLGCVVARTLMAWGVRHITLIDNSRVSYSNPVRQSLYTLEDCLDGGKPKAEAAAGHLRDILPSVEVRGIDMDIPMPGHPPANAAIALKQRAAVVEMNDLVSNSDVVFLLTDTRESRWLPALLCAAHGKLAITAAVGFDSFVVMRHGGPPNCTTNEEHASHSSTATSFPRLGCYFCNDVVAPMNSTENRSLDQQCTVARPGLASVAGALAVELMAAVVVHPDGVNAPPPSKESPERARNPDILPLGPPPHMVRGQLNGFQQVVMEGCAFSQCTACSGVVVGEYAERGAEFVMAAVGDAKYLEQVTGLDKLFVGLDDDLEGMDDEDEGEGGVGDSLATVGEKVDEGKEVDAGPGTGDDGADEDWTEL